MNLTLTWNTPSTLIRGTSLKRQSAGTLPTSAGSCVKNSSNKSLLWEGDQQSHSRRKEVIWQREVCCQNVSHSFKMPVCVSATILCFDIIHSLAQETRSASVTHSIWRNQESFQFGGIKLWHRQEVHQRRKRRGKICNLPFPLRTGSRRAMEKHNRTGKNGKSLG